MSKRVFPIVLGSLCLFGASLPLSAHAQSATEILTGGCRVNASCPLPVTSIGGSTSPVSINQTTPGTTNGVVTNPGSVTTASPPTFWAGALTQATGTCTTTSSTIVSANSATSSMAFFLPSTAANVVWLNFNGVAATAALPNYPLMPGASITFTIAQGLLPTSAVTCIATAATSVGEIYK